MSRFQGGAQGKAGRHASNYQGRNLYRIHRLISTTVAIFRIVKFLDRLFAGLSSYFANQFRNQIARQLTAHGLDQFARNLVPYLKV